MIKLSPVPSNNLSPRGRMPDGEPNPIDIHIGKRIRMRRQNLALSQQTLGDYLGLTFQQIQKYEKGINRVCGSRLFGIATALNVSVQYFFDDIPPETLKLSPSALKAATHQPCDTQPSDPLYKSENIALITAFNKISDMEIKKALANLLLNLK